MKIIKLRYLILLLAGYLLVSCSGKKGREEEAANLYSFDKTKIGIEISDDALGIKFNPPLDWDLTPSSLSKKIENRNNPGEGFIYEPVYIFFDKANGSVLSCGKVNSTDTTVTKSSEINFYKGLLSTKYKDSNISMHTFVHSQITFTLVMFEKENLSGSKLFFQNSSGQIIQLEYSFRKDSEELVSSAIKASIGSIRLIN